MSIIKAPCGLNLDADTFEVNGQTVKGKKEALAPATASKLGGVKIGNGLSVETDGTVSADIDLSTTISSASTNMEIPSAKAVYDYVEQRISEITNASE